VSGRSNILTGFLEVEVAGATLLFASDYYWGSSPLERMAWKEIEFDSDTRK
jgi:hypothetical protein